MVYPWIYLDILSVLKPDFSAGPCCWIHAMRTRLLVFKSVLFSEKIERASQHLVVMDKLCCFSLSGIIRGIFPSVHPKHTCSLLK